MVSARLPDWEARLSAFLAANHDRPFAWGSWDCALFACAAVEAMTGEHPFPAFPGAYDTREGAAAALRRLGKGTLVRTWETRFPARAPGFARRGDIVMVADAMGVCMGGTALFIGEEHLTGAIGIPPREGLVTVPRALWTGAWAT